MKHYFLIVVVVIVFSACEKDISACFTASKTTALQGDNISFNDCSKGGGFLDSSDPNNWTWDFGDGSTGTGAAINHAFIDTGMYIVTLTVKDEDGDKTGTTSQSIKVIDSVCYAIFWSKNSPVGINVYISAIGLNGWIEQDFSTAPTCGTNKCFNPVFFKEGSYHYDAMSTVKNWSGDIVVKHGQCTAVQLD